LLPAGDLKSLLSSSTAWVKSLYSTIPFLKEQGIFEQDQHSSIDIYMPHLHSLSQILNSRFDSLSTILTSRQASSDMGTAAAAGSGAATSSPFSKKRVVKEVRK